MVQDPQRRRAVELGVRSRVKEFPDVDAVSASDASSSSSPARGHECLQNREVTSCNDSHKTRLEDLIKGLREFRFRLCLRLVWVRVKSPGIQEVDVQLNKSTSLL